MVEIVLSDNSQVVSLLCVYELVPSYPYSPGVKIVPNLKYYIVAMYVRTYVRMYMTLGTAQS